MTLFLVLYATLGLFFIGLALPLIQRRVKPNAWYGFRVQQTLDDPQVWYEANAYAGKYLLGVGIATMVGAIGLCFVPQLDEGAYMWGCTAIVLIGLGVNVLQSFRFLRKYQNK